MKYLMIWMAFLITTTTVQAELKVLAFSGSTRNGAYNQALTKEAARIASEKGAKVTVINLEDFEMPFYQADVEAAKGMPKNAKKFRDLMLSHDRIIIASPEYNGSVTAVLKNALDWASRSEKGEFSADAFKGKTFALMSASPGKGGGKRSLDHLHQIIVGLGGKTTHTEVVVPQSYLAFDGKERLKNNDTKKRIEQAVNELLY